MFTWIKDLFSKKNTMTLTDNFEIDCGQYSLRIKTRDGSWLIVSTVGIDIYSGTNHIRVGGKWIEINGPTKINGKVIE